MMTQGPTTRHEIIDATRQGPGFLSLTVYALAMILAVGVVAVSAVVGGPVLGVMVMLGIASAFVLGAVFALYRSGS